MNKFYSVKITMLVMPLILLIGLVFLCDKQAQACLVNSDCNTPGVCQIPPGRCDLVTSTCRYSDDPNFCHFDGDVCTGDVCISSDDGLTSQCTPGINICGGLVPCERMVNDPDTVWDDTKPCSFCHAAMLVSQGINFLFKIAGVVALLALIVTGILFITSAGSPERRNSAKEAFKWVLIGFLIVFLSWLFVDFILSAWGYLDPIGGKWNVICD